MIRYKTKTQIDGIRKSCKVLAQVMQQLRDAVKPGVNVKDLDALAEKLIREKGGVPAFKNYRPFAQATPFPATLCASVNDEVVHGIGTRDIVLQEGDIIGLDLGINLDGYYSDMAVTVPVGKIDPKIQTLLDVTKASLENGIKQMSPGNTVLQVAEAIENTITPHGYGIVKDFVGHGVGLAVHEDPRIPNYVTKARYMRDDYNLQFESGMVLAVEPMVNIGGDDVEMLDDDWTVVTADGSLSAHFEHTVAILDDRYEVLTKLD